MDKKHIIMSIFVNLIVIGLIILAVFVYKDSHKVIRTILILSVALLLVFFELYSFVILKAMKMANKEKKNG